MAADASSGISAQVGANDAGENSTATTVDGSSDSSPEAGHVDAQADGSAISPEGEEITCYEPCEDPTASCPILCEDAEAVCGPALDTSDGELGNEPCEVSGQRCIGPDACSGADCECTESEDGTLRWLCSVRLC